MATEQDDFAAQLQQAIRQQFELIFTLRKLIALYVGKGYQATPDQFTVVSAEKVGNAILSLSALDNTALAAAANATKENPVTNQDNIAALV